MRAVVLGSSQGLLAAYLCYCFAMDRGSSAALGADGEPDGVRLRVTGFEVLSELHTTAVQTALLLSAYLRGGGDTDVDGNSHGHSSPDVVSVPVLGDMFNADLTSADVVVLTSLCWDVSTRRAIALKLSNELPKGAVVVDFPTDTFDIARRELHPRCPTPSSGPSAPRPNLVPKRSSDSGRTPLSSLDVMAALDRVISGSPPPTQASARNKGQQRLFELVGFVEGPVSWEQEQALAFFRAV